MPRQIPDPKVPDSVVRVTDFPGMSPGTDQHSNPPGASWFQVNAVSLFPGELRVRRGFRVVRFDQPVRLQGFLCSAGNSYVMVPAAAGSAPEDLPVTAQSTYVVSAFSPTGGSFDLSGTF